MVTGIVALLPEGTMTFAVKVLSVFVLAMAAELGRRIVTIVWKKKK